VGYRRGRSGVPFDYEENTLLFLPTDMPEPNQPGYQRAASNGLIELAKRIRGRTLVLFTSYSQLRQTANAIKEPLADSDIVVYQQGDGSSRRQMIENFKECRSGGILLGTRSFWEGVDIPGPALSCVVITRIPFAVPSDPIVSARSETFENAFAQYSIPQAILAFRQGFGRLIRNQDRPRRGCDFRPARNISKSYGQAFLRVAAGCNRISWAIEQSAANRRKLDRFWRHRLIDIKFGFTLSLAANW
jgi:hypothetical protein